MDVTGITGEGVSPYVAGRDRFAFAGGQAFEVNTGYPLRLEGKMRFGHPVLAADAWYTPDAVLDPATLRVTETAVQVSETSDAKDSTPPQHVFAGTIAKAGALKGTVALRAGPRIVMVDKGAVRVLEGTGKGAEPKLVCQAPVAGSLSTVLAAGGRVLAVALDGTVSCFGPDPVPPKTHGPEKPEIAAGAAPGPWADRAAAILKAAGVTDGYALVWGLRDGGLVEAIVHQSNLHVIAMDRDAVKVDALRRRLDAAGLYGTRAAAIVGDPAAETFAPYFASLVACEDPTAAGLDQGPAPAERLFHVLRPYGGAAVLELPDDRHAAFAAAVKQANLAGAEAKRQAGLTLLVRAGALPGSAPWLGQNADAGNSRCTRDRLVQAPLGILWFGNAMSNSLVLPRHGEGPVEQIVGGRLFIEGPESLTACDVYTGRVLWTRAFKGLGRLYDVTSHQKGAHSIGSNFYAVADAVYVAAGETCHVLDPATGRTTQEFRLPPKGGLSAGAGGPPSPWQFMLIYQDLLIAGAEPVIDADQPRGGAYSPTSSRRLVAMERASGRVLWTRDARYAFRHYGIAAGGGKVFCIDRLAPEMLTGEGGQGDGAVGPPKGAARTGRATPAILVPSGVSPPPAVQETPLILALEARTGQVVWQTDRHVGEALSYSAEHDILVAQAALRGKDGSVIWEDAGVVPDLESGKWGLMLCGRTILTQKQKAVDLLTGAPKMRLGPDGGDQPWQFPRTKGCGPIAASEGLLTFRSGCAGFFDLRHDGGTGNLGGFRSGCTNNLLAADGVLNAPDYTRTCTCNYANRSSLALVHMPEAEYWTCGAAPWGGRLGINFGAPGDRRADDGTLWLDWPGEAGGPSVEVPLRVQPQGATPFRRHSSRMQGGDGPAWVAASGVEGVEQAALPLAPWLKVPGRFTVRLVFAEPQDRKAGERVFTVAIQGREVLKDFDLVRQAGGPWRALVREFKGVEARDALTVTLTPRAGKPVLCGLEVVDESPAAPR